MTPEDEKQLQHADPQKWELLQIRKRFAARFPYRMLEKYEGEDNRMAELRENNLRAIESYKGGAYGYG